MSLNVCWTDRIITHSSDSMSSSVRAEVPVVFIQDVRRQRKLVQHTFGMSLDRTKDRGDHLCVAPRSGDSVAEVTPELSRAEALKLWAEKRQAGWSPCSPQW